MKAHIGVDSGTKLIHSVAAPLRGHSIGALHRRYLRPLRPRTRMTARRWKTCCMGMKGVSRAIRLIAANARSSAVAHPEPRVSSTACRLKGVIDQAEKARSAQVQGPHQCRTLFRRDDARIRLYQGPLPGDQQKRRLAVRHLRPRQSLHGQAAPVGSIGARSCQPPWLQPQKIRKLLPRDPPEARSKIRLFQKVLKITNLFSDPLRGVIKAALKTILISQMDQSDSVKLLAKHLASVSFGLNRN